MFNSPPVKPSKRPEYWFPAKRFGWGWGALLVWQGWLVLIGYIFLLGLACVVFPVQIMFVKWAASILSLSLILIAICFLKGEPLH
ncbi:hypothetical protein [Aquirhabdus sp.]|uniref:hypothetical protein n=1 Tax=Aquirhabdus sp. TaxID=2824160 RepID=UPI00396CE284